VWGSTGQPGIAATDRYFDKSGETFVFKFAETLPPDVSVTAYIWNATSGVPVAIDTDGTSASGNTVTIKRGATNWNTVSTSVYGIAFRLYKARPGTVPTQIYNSESITATNYVVNIGASIGPLSYAIQFATAD
jgi:hypothetical protein